jgi:hypothetical protein
MEKEKQNILIQKFEEDLLKENPHIKKEDIRVIISGDSKPKIELKANHFYRGNPYVSAVGALLGFTSEQLDKFFETNDYTVLLPVEVEDENTTNTTI